MKKILFTVPLLIFGLLNSVCLGQDTVNRVSPPGYDPHYDKIIPDKVFEIGLPLLVLYLLANAILNIFKTRAENRLKEKALDKQISETALVALFNQDRILSRYSYLKWFLVLAALGISFVTIQLLANSSSLISGYMAVGIICMDLSVAFLIYFYIIRNK